MQSKPFRVINNSATTHQGSRFNLQWWLLYVTLTSIFPSSSIIYSLSPFPFLSLSLAIQIMITNEALSVIDASGRQFSLLNNDTSVPVYKRSRTSPPSPLPEMSYPRPQCPPSFQHRHVTSSNGWQYREQNGMPAACVSPTSPASRGNSCQPAPPPTPTPPVNTKRKYHCTEPGCNKSFTTR